METKVLDTCEFACIEEDVNLWVELIKKTNLDTNRKEAENILKDKNFDIRESAKILRKVYVGKSK